jgi:hypothetical protein
MVIDTDKFKSYIRENNPTVEMVMEHFQISRSTVYYNCKKNDIVLRKLTKEEMAERVKEGFLKKYGVDNISRLASNKQKVRNTYLSKTKKQKENIKMKMKQTSLEKYGVEHYVKTDDYKKKVQKTNLEKYGVE